MDVPPTSTWENQPRNHPNELACTQRHRDMAGDHTTCDDT